MFTTHAKQRSEYTYELLLYLHRPIIHYLKNVYFFFFILRLISLVFFNVNFDEIK